MEPTPTQPIVADSAETLASAVTQLALSKRAGRTLQEALDELDRELAVRHTCYDKWLAKGTLTKSDAKDRMERMVAAFKFLEEFADLTGVVKMGAADGMPTQSEPSKNTPF